MATMLRGVPLYDALIIGAGPAGSTLARQLARAGQRVLVVDTEPLGRDRACGGFLGPERLALWEELGLEPQLPTLAAAPVSWLLLSGPGGSRVHTALPVGGGVGVSRATYDYWLCAQAQEAGATFWAPARVRRIRRLPGQMHVVVEQDGGLQDVVARVVVRATGRRHVREQGDPAREVFFGCKTVYEGLKGLDDAVALHFVRQGHVGFNRLPDGRATMCLYIGQSRLRAVTGRLDELMMQLAEENPEIGKALAAARRAGVWVTCQAQPDGRARFLHQGCFHVGDAVAMLNPVLGGGLSLAMGSSVLLARHLLAAAPSLDLEAIARRYEQDWRLYYAGRLQFGRWLGWCERTVGVAEPVLRLLSAVPAMAHHAVRYARPALTRS